MTTRSKLLAKKMELAAERARPREERDLVEITSQHASRGVADSSINIRARHERRWRTLTDLLGLRLQLERDTPLAAEDQATWHDTLVANIHGIVDRGTTRLFEGLDEDTGRFGGGGPLGSPWREGILDEIKQLREQYLKEAEILRDQRELDSRALTPASAAPAQLNYDDRLPLLRRAVFDADIASLAEAPERVHEPLALIMIDLDHFKAVNDRYGHAIADDVLLEVSRRLAARVRGKGSIYRYGGDEIAVLLPNYCVDEALVLAECLRGDVAERPVSSRDLKVTASFGVACLPRHGTTATELFQLADEALYQAKDVGGNYVHITGEPTPSAPAPRVISRRPPEPGAGSGM